MSATTYEGSCHCGAVKYEADLDLSNPVIGCNCSMCQRKGTLLTFVPEGAFRLKAGEGATTDYTFNKNIIHHLFCKTCGVTSYAKGKNRDGSPMYAINARCLEGVEIDDLKINKWDGRSA
jgi:hypothetical protein